ncbi:MAG: thioredoxin family protein [Thermoanaerobaculia bacterium]|nr:thioredoxin family protein [Thermoanaerobaculia bacterium]
MRVVLLLVAVACALPAAAADTPAGFDPSAWDDDAVGFFEALRTIEEGDERAMVVYFYTDWCGYCRQFEKELLGTPAVKSFLSGLVAVRINPENGEQERRIAQYYGVSGYPAFFVQGRRSRSMTKVERMVVEDGKPRLMAPERFVETLAAAAGR